MAEALAIGVKQAARRDRPSGSGFSFPSGHTTASFAAATVLQRHFGWKVGIPAYVLASYVGASRIQNERHYLSDVTFGAALGVIAGRTTALGRQRAFTVSPVVVPIPPVSSSVGSARSRIRPGRPFQIRMIR